MTRNLVKKIVFFDCPCRLWLIASGDVSAIFFKHSERPVSEFLWWSTRIDAEGECNQAHGRDNKASKTTSRTMLQRATNTQHAARSTACCLDSLGPRDDLRPRFIDTNSTLLLPTFQSPLSVDFGLLRRTSSYFCDLTLIVTRVTLTSIRHL